MTEAIKLQMPRARAGDRGNQDKNAYIARGLAAETYIIVLQHFNKPENDAIVLFRKKIEEKNSGLFWS